MMRLLRVDCGLCTNVTDRRGDTALAIASDIAIRAHSHLQQLSRPQGS